MSMAARAFRAAPDAAESRTGSAPAIFLDSLGARLETLFDRERDQLALWLPVGLGLGVAAWFSLPNPGAWTAFLLAAAGLAVAALAAAAVAVVLIFV